MTALSLKRLIAEAMADVGIKPSLAALKGRPRVTRWSTTQPGFGVRHYAGGREVYVVQTRMNGKLRVVTVGPASVLSRSQASAVAKRVLAYAVVGDDPAEERKRIRNAPTFQDFVTEYWRRCEPTWKPSTKKTHRNYRNKHLTGAFSDKFVDELDRADVAKWFAQCTNRGGPGAGNRTLSIVRNMMNKAEEWGYRLPHTNPCQGLKRNRRRKFERFLSIAELERLGPLLAVDRMSAAPNVMNRANALTLLLLTGCRHNEILQLKWSDIRGHRIELKDSKSGPRTVWLGDEARSLLAGMKRWPKVEWLFWNPATKKVPSDIGPYWNGLQTRAGLSGLRVHDLRHTFASHAAMGKETVPMIGKLLGHLDISSTLRYAHFDDEYLVGGAQTIGNAIAALMGDALSTAKVLMAQPHDKNNSNDEPDNPTLVAVDRLGRQRQGFPVL